MNAPRKPNSSEKSAKQSLCVPLQESCPLPGVALPILSTASPESLRQSLPVAGYSRPLTDRVPGRIQDLQEYFIQYPLRM